uniref:Uncharacterized protein n=1 Tax=viral metagenome TaxID=1070528 RepID=A0A6M3IWC9_9ZZZZ
MEIEKSIRRRINVSTSVKGIKTWDVTVDCVGYSEDEALAESDSIVAKLETRYPTPEV